MPIRSHQLRCIANDVRIAPEAIASDFRDPETRELYEVEYSWSEASGGSPRNLPNAAALRHLWAARRDSKLPIAQSGVWR